MTPASDESELIELSVYSSLKLQHTQVDLASFWILSASQHPSIQAIKFLLPFTTTYLCESGFSIAIFTKSKARNKPKATSEATLRVHVRVSPVTPRPIVSIYFAQYRLQLYITYLHSSVLVYSSPFCHSVFIICSSTLNALNKFRS